MRIRSLTSDRRGATLIEFGLVAPAFIGLLVGAIELTHTAYVKTVLHGEIQRAARASTLETASTGAAQALVDDRITKQLKRLHKDADITVTRRFYRTFSAAQAAQREPVVDSNGNARCDNGESYTDVNGNGVWDADGGDSGQGGARDVVVYSASALYNRLTPAPKLLGFSEQVRVSARTVLANQPYSPQGVYAAPVTRNCTP